VSATHCFMTSRSREIRPGTAVLECGALEESYQHI
jgi:hypothetical protein